jgi:hypothetical protein
MPFESLLGLLFVPAHIFDAAGKNWPRRGLPGRRDINGRLLGRRVQPLGDLLKPALLQGTKAVETVLRSTEEALAISSCLHLDRSQRPYDKSRAGNL